MKFNDNFDRNSISCRVNKSSAIDDNCNTLHYWKQLGTCAK